MLPDKHNRAPNSQMPNPDQKQKTPWRFPLTVPITDLTSSPSVPLLCTFIKDSSDCSNHWPQSQLHIHPICTLLWVLPVSTDKLLIAAVSRVRLPFELASQHPTPFEQQHLTASFSNLTSEIGITCASCFDLFPSYSFLLFHPFLNNISTNIFICWLCNTCAIQLLECAIPRPLVAKQPDFRCHFIFLTKKIRENAAIRNPLVAKRPDFLCHFIFSQKRMVVLGN